MIDQSLRLSLDIVFPPPCHYPNTSKHLAPEAKLEILYSAKGFYSGLQVAIFIVKLSRSTKRHAVRKSPYRHLSLKANYSTNLNMAE